MTDLIGAIIVIIIYGLVAAIPQINDVLPPEAELAYLYDNDESIECSTWNSLRKE